MVLFDVLPVRTLGLHLKMQNIEWVEFLNLMYYNGL